MMRWLRRLCWVLGDSAPRCHVCHGKGWISPSDASREIDKAWELFIAGYDHATATADEVKT